MYLIDLLYREKKFKKKYRKNHFNKKNHAMGETN